MGTFRGRYRTGSYRYHGYDYSSPGEYFITIDVKNFRPCFGKIIDGKVLLSEAGKIAEKCWSEIPNHFKHINIDEFVIMPDHMHGIICICEMKISPSPEIEQIYEKQKNRNANPHMSEISPSKGSLAAIIRSYKSAVSKMIHDIDHRFEWQSLYYDHIIRGHDELCRIRNYIRNNPKNAKL
jgi:REP element-mobilizing transposase RayT